MMNRTETEMCGIRTKMCEGSQLSGYTGMRFGADLRLLIPIRLQKNSFLLDLLKISCAYASSTK